MPGKYPTPADTDDELDWDKVMALSWRPAWSIRSRRGTLVLMRALIASWFRRAP